MAWPVKAKVPLIIPALLVSASAVSILSTDLYTPSLPHLQSYFATDPATVQLTMSLNLAGYALAQLAYGPLSDRYGRRPVLLVTLFGFALASLACALAFSIEGLIGARTLQGILACAETVVGLAIMTRPTACRSWPPTAWQLRWRRRSGQSSGARCTSGSAGRPTSCW
jgi:MFS family permease